MRLGCYSIGLNVFSDQSIFEVGELDETVVANDAAEADVKTEVSLIEFDVFDVMSVAEAEAPPATQTQAHNRDVGNLADFGPTTSLPRNPDFDYADPAYQSNFGRFADSGPSISADQPSGSTTDPSVR